MKRLARFESFGAGQFGAGQFDARRLSAGLVSALVVAVVATLPASAQHGAAHGSGFAGHSAPAFHASPPVSSGFRPSAPSGARPAPYGMRTAPGYPAGQSYQGSRYAGAPRSYSTGGPVYPYAYSTSSARRATPNGQHSPYGNHQPSNRRPYGGQYNRGQYNRGHYRVAYGGAYLAWPAPYYLGDPYLDPYAYDDSYDSSINGGYDSGYSGGQSTAPYAQPNDAQPNDPRYGSGYGPGYDPGYGGQGNGPGGYPAAPPDPSASVSYFGPDYAPTYRPDYQPATPASRPASPPAAQPTITLVFKDGRPVEQIHNYLLSRDSITVWDKPAGGLPREIRIDQLNIAATEKANNDAGVDFYLPRNIQ